MSPRWLDKRAERPGPRHRRRAPGALLGDGAGWQGRHRIHPGDRVERQNPLPKTASTARSGIRVEDSEVEQHTGARPSENLFQAYAAAAALYFSTAHSTKSTPAARKTWNEFKVPERGHWLRVPRSGARRAFAPRRDSRRQNRQLPPTLRRPGTPARQARDPSAVGVRPSTRTHCGGCAHPATVPDQTTLEFEEPVELSMLAMFMGHVLNVEVEFADAGLAGHRVSLSTPMTIEHAQLLSFMKFLLAQKGYVLEKDDAKGKLIVKPSKAGMGAAPWKMPGGSSTPRGCTCTPG